MSWLFGTNCCFLCTFRRVLEPFEVSSTKPVVGRFSSQSAEEKDNEAVREKRATGSERLRFPSGEDWPGLALRQSFRQRLDQQFLCVIYQQSVQSSCWPCAALRPLKNEGSRCCNSNVRCVCVTLTPRTRPLFLPLDKWFHLRFCLLEMLMFMSGP